MALKEFISFRLSREEHAAVKAAAWRNAGTDGSRAFQLKDCPEVGPLAAMARALHTLKPTREFWGAVG